MKITVKALAGGNFGVEAEGSDTIGALKSKITQLKGHPEENQKIIYHGKILGDTETIKACGITEKEFIVMMVSKPKAAKKVDPPATAPAKVEEAAAAPPPAAESSTSAVASEPTKSDEPITVEPSSGGQEGSASKDAGSAVAVEDASSASTTSTPAAAPAPAPADAAAAATAQSTSGGLGLSSSFISGSQLEHAVQGMMEMGFERDQVMKAMRASFNNPDRAVEYLMTGIPDHLNRPPQEEAPAAGEGGAVPATSPAPAAAAPQQTPSSAGTATAPAAAAAAAPANPRAGNLFEAAAAAAAAGNRRGGGAAGGLGHAIAGTDPDDDGDDVEMTGAPGSGQGGGGGGAGGAGAGGERRGQTIDLGNPAMLNQLRQLVAQNPAALQPLVQAIAQSNPHLAQAMQSNPEAVLAMLSGAADEGEDLPTFDQLTPEDRSAVEQISAMGIPQDRAIECYIMCGKDVEMAVQYYFENQDEFDD